MFVPRVFLLAALTQTVPDLPVRLGYTGAHVSRLDVADIAAALSADAANIWLVVAHGPNLLNQPVWYVDVFLAPERATGGLRRGKTMTVKGTLIAPQVYEGRKPWDKVSSNEYAQIAMPAPEPFRVTNDADLRRPFRVMGSFTDQELILLVDFVRRGLRATGVKIPAPHDKVRGDWPIAVIRRGVDVEVTLVEPTDRQKSGQTATLRWDGSSWTVTNVRYWIAH